jgi:hypothetical protein
MILNKNISKNTIFINNYNNYYKINKFYRYLLTKKQIINICIINNDYIIVK